MRQRGKEADRGYVINSDHFGQLGLSPVGDLWESLEHKPPGCLHALPISTGWRLLPLTFLAQWLWDQRELSRKGYGSGR